MITEETETATPRSRPKILIVLFILQCIQLALAIAVIVYLVIAGYMGFISFTAISHNSATSCNDSFVYLKYITELDEQVVLSFIASIILVLSGLLILIITLKILITGQKLEQKEEQAAHRTLIRQIKVRIISLFIGYIVSRVMYIIQSMFVLMCVIVFGKYLSFLLQLSKACSFTYDETQLIIIVALSGAALLIGLIVWILIVCIIFGLRSQLFEEEDKANEKSQQDNKSQKKVNNKNKDEGIKSKQEQKRKKQNEYRREETFEDLRDYEKQKEEEQNERKKRNVYNYQQPKKEEKRQQDPTHKEHRDTFRRYDDNEPKEKLEDENRYYDKYNDKKSPKKYQMLNDDNEDKYYRKQEPYNNNKNNSGYDMSPKRRSAYRSKFMEDDKKEPNQSRQESPQRSQGLIYSRNPNGKQYEDSPQNDDHRERPSTFKSRKNLYQSPYKQVEQSPYYNQSQRREEPKYSNNRNRLYEDNEGYRERDYLNNQPNNKILPDGGIYEGSRSKNHESYFKDSRNSSFGNPPKKRKGILNDYIRGKYIE